MRMMTGILIGALVVSIAALFSPVEIPRPFDIDGNRATVAHIVDGDTLDLNGVERRVRIWGIDTPERGENGFQAASEALQRLTRGQFLTYIQMQAKPDPYGRIVCRLVRDDGLDIGKAMIEQGHAREYCRYSKDYYSTCKD